MDYRTRMEYFKAIFNRYRRASRREKGRILDEFCETTGHNRKYAIAKLNGSLEPPPRRRSGPRAPHYAPEALKIIEEVWKRSGYPWSERLKVILKDWLPWIRKRLRPRPDIERQILAISSRQLDRRLKPLKSRLRTRIYGRTKPGRILKHHIPVRAVHWDVRKPGWTEIDLVAHSGNCGAGEFAYSLNLTDIQTGWVETRAVLGKGEEGVMRALEELEGTLPFRLRGIDSDNGSEFINFHLYNHCVSRDIEFTRGRPYAKQDNAHVEQKNFTHVRRLMGYDRYDTPQAVLAMNELYRHEVRLMMNLFQPSVKLKSKARVGSRLCRRHDAPQTPLGRLKACLGPDSIAVRRLERLRESLDPFELSDAIDAKLGMIRTLADQRTWPRNPLPPQPRPTRRRLGPPMARLGFKRRDYSASRLDFSMA